MSERSDLHYVTSPEGEWRCAECQQMCHDDARCDCCLYAVAQARRVDKSP